MNPQPAIRPAQRRLVCPDCQSESLKIKHLKGWERVMVFLSDRRKYGCKACGLWFRAKDRRRFPRPDESVQSAWAAGLPFG
jgi:rubredoxin